MSSVISNFFPHTYTLLLHRCSNCDREEAVRLLIVNPRTIDDDGDDADDDDDDAFLAQA